jgi:hypothetical protein
MWSPCETMAYASNPILCAQRVPMHDHSSSEIGRSSSATRRDWWAMWRPSPGRKSWSCPSSWVSSAAVAPARVPPITSARGRSSPLWSFAPIK